MSYLVKDTIEILKQKFQNIEFSFKEVHFRGYIPIFFIFIKDSTKLEKYWIEISDTIAIEYQARLQDEFKSWNIYLFYVTNSFITKELKYKIENDTFSSRKVVIEGTFDENSIINEHVFNSISISKDENEIQTSSFEPNKLLSCLLQNKVLKMQRVTRSASKTFQKFLEELKIDRDEI